MQIQMTAFGKNQFIGFDTSNEVMKPHIRLFEEQASVGIKKLSKVKYLGQVTSQLG